MKYKILSAQRIEDTLVTQVEYTIGQRKVTVDVSHFQPKSLAEIQQSIVNRFSSESRKNSARDEIETLLPQIVLNEEVVIDG